MWRDTLQLAGSRESWRRASASPQIRMGRDEMLLSQGEFLDVLDVAAVRGVRDVKIEGAGVGGTYSTFGPCEHRPVQRSSPPLTVERG